MEDVDVAKSDESVLNHETDSTEPKIETSEAKIDVNDDETKTQSTESKDKLATPSGTSPPSLSNCILFYGVTYLGCSSVNAPKSEAEINRIMSTLNEQGKMCIEVSMSVPQTVEEKIILFDSSSNEVGENANSNVNIIAEYKMAQVLFVVRGGKNSPEANCFAFTTCHGDNMENLMFSCHVFRCKLMEAVSKILYSFWSVFNRQNSQASQQQQQSQNQKQQPAKSGSISSTSSTATSQLSSVASSLLGSLYGFGGSLNTNVPSNTSNTQYSPSFIYNCEQAVKFVNGQIEDQYVFRASVEIKEQDPRNPSLFTSVPKEKEFFKLRKNLEKQINIQIQQLNNQTLEIERCFGVLMCQGRNVSHKDMQLLNTISMGRSDSGPNGSTLNTTSTSSNNSSSGGFTNSLSNNNGYLVSASWNPLDTTTTSSLQVLNEETHKNTRVFMTVAVDLVINGLQDPVRFCIETKARIYPQNDKFWVYQKNKHHEIFYLQIVKKPTEISLNESASNQNLSTSNHIYNLHSIHSETELSRKQNAIEHQKKIGDQESSSSSTINTTNTSQTSDDESEVVMSGLGNVSKDCAEEELMDWSDLLSKWRKTTWNERPKSLQNFVRKGIPEALRGEVWQLLAGCNEDEKKMNESYRVLLSRESSCENVILRDINRTFPGHPFFQEESGQQALYKLSKAYSIYDEEVGYCQGLSFLIATLLLHMPEEQTFNLLVKIMYRYEIREIYKTNFECLHLRFFQLESLIREFLPELNEHFIDLNIEAHMYASQWFLTLFTAKFPLYMVFRILDLFLYEGFLAIFSIAISLLKASQRDLLALDFEGVLKYFRVTMPKKYRLEQTFNNQLMQIWVNIHSKITDKKIKKYEKNYKQMKEAEELKENPLIRYERECKRLNAIVRRLEQENDDLANEYIESKINLSKQIEDNRDDYELVKNELFKYKTDYQNKLNETNDTNKKLTSELDQVKQLWRKQSEKYENELERNNIIISEYKNICNTLSNKDKKKSSSSSQKRLEDEQVTVKFSSLCETCIEKVKITTNSNEIEPLEDDVEKNSSQLDNTIDESVVDADNETLAKIKNLELELARVKLELVDAQCKNQELDHTIKNIRNGDPQASALPIANNVNNKIADPINSMSSSTSSLNQYTPNTINSSALNATNFNGSNSSINNNPNTNNWLSKTFTQFKQATNQVVQKAQKVNNTMSLDTNNS